MERPCSIALIPLADDSVLLVIACVTSRSLLLADALHSSSHLARLRLDAHLPTLSTARVMLQYVSSSRSLLCFAHGALAIVRVADADENPLVDDSAIVSVGRRHLRLFVHASYWLGQLWPIAAMHPHNDSTRLLVCTMQSIVLSVNTLESSRIIDPAQGVRCAEPSLLCCASFAPTAGGDIVAVGSLLGDLLVWSAVDGAIVQRCSGHEGSVRCVQWSADALTILTASEDRSVRVWRRPRADAPFQCAASLFGHDGRVWSCSLFPSGDAFCSGGEDGAVRQWSLRTSAPAVARAEVCHAADVWQVDSCRVGDGLVLMASVARDGTVRVAQSSRATPAICDNALLDATVAIDSPASVSTVRICPWSAALFVGFASGRVARLVGDAAGAYRAEPLGDYGGRGVAYLSVCDSGALLLVGTNVGDLVAVRVADGGVVAEARGAHRDRVRFCAAERVSEDMLLLLSSAQGDGLAISTLQSGGTIVATRARSQLHADDSGSATSGGRKKFGAACVFSAAVARAQCCVVAGDSGGALHLVGLPAALCNADAAWSGAVDALCGGAVSLRSVHGGDRVTAISLRLWAPRALVATSFGRDGCCAESLFAIDDAGAVTAVLARRFRLLGGVLPPTNLLRCESVHSGVVAVLHGRTFAAVDVASGYAHAGAVSEAASLGVVYDCVAVNGVLWALHPAAKGTVRIAATRVAAPLLPLVHSQYVDAAHYIAAPLALAFTGGEDTRIGVWCLHSRRLVQFLHSHSGAVFCFADDGAATLLSGGARGSVCEHALERHSADGSILARQRNVSGWAAVAEALGHDCRVIALAAWRAAGQLRVAVGTADGRLLRLESDGDGVRAVGAAIALRSAIFSLAAAGGGALLVCGAADGGVRVLDSATGALVRLQAGHQSGVTALSVAALDGSSLVRVCSGGDDQALLVADYDCAAEWRCVRLTRVSLAHGGAVRAVALVGAEARVVVTASADERAARWRIGSAHAALTIDRESVQLTGVEETSGAALCGDERVLLAVGNGATFVQFLAG